MKILKNFFKREFWRYAIVISILTVVDLGQVYIPQFTKSAIDSISKNDVSSLIRFSIYIAIVSIGIVVLRFLYQHLLRSAVLRFDYELKNKIFSSFIRFNKKTLEKFEIGDLMSRVTNDTTSVRMFLIMGFLGIVDVFVLGVTTFIFMLRMNVKLTIAVTVPLLFLFPLALNFGTKIHKFYRKINAIFADISVRVREAISGIRVIKSFVKEKYFWNIFKSVNEEYLRQNLKVVKLDGFFDPIVSFLINISNLILIFYGGVLFVNQGIDVGTMAAFFQYIETLTWPMMAVGFSIAYYQRATASLARIDEVISIPEREEGTLVDEIKNIYIKNLHFSYDDNIEVLKGINMSIEKGKTIGITGNPGSGKTTLINLILKVVEAPKNSLYFDGLDINDVSFEAIKNNFAYVPQESFLFSDTILNNLLIGKPDATFDEVVEATKIACIYDDIMNFKDKFDSVIGEQGITLSGGERQRLSIARAILSKKPFLILDDALSSVDFKTEDEIVKNLKELFSSTNLTVIIISERLSSLMIADKIHVLIDGELVEEGIFSELLTKEGYFYHLYRKQLLEANL